MPDLKSNILFLADKENKELEYLVTDRELKIVDRIKLLSTNNKTIGSAYAPPPLVFSLIRKYGCSQNGIPLETMITTAKFRLVDQCFGMAGITLGDTVLLLKDYVLRHPCEIINGSVDSTLPGLIYHELTHVSQVLNDGSTKFLVKYIWQWIKSGFSYDKMKYIGYEKQAYLAQYELVNMINTYGV